jgi:hypothetical protein
VLTPRPDSSRREQFRWEATKKFVIRSPWIKPAAFVVGTAALVQLFVVLPLRSQVVEMRSELDAMHTAVNRLADVGDQAWQTNDLLGALEAQAAALDGATASLTQLEELQHEIVGLAHLAEQARVQLGPSRDTLQELARLEEELAAHSTRLADAESTLAEIESLRAQLVAQGENLNQVTEIVDRQNALALSVMSGHEAVVAANDQMGAYESLAEQVLAAGNKASEAEAVVGQLTAIQDLLLDEERVQPVRAQQNLDSLIALEDALAGETDRIADAVASLELLADFQEEFNFQVGQLAGMQESLTELILLESSVARAVRMIEPLAELTDLRRLNEDEVREAARVILDRRNTRVSSRPVDLPPMSESDEEIERLVPVPPVE